MRTLDRLYIGGKTRMAQFINAVSYTHLRAHET